MRAQFLFIRTRMNMADRHVAPFGRYIFEHLPSVHEIADLAFRSTPRGYVQVFGPQKARGLLRIFLVHLSAHPGDIDAALWRAASQNPQLCRGMRSITMSQLQIETGFNARLLSLTPVTKLFADRIQQPQTNIQWRALPAPKRMLSHSRMTPSP